MKLSTRIARLRNIGRFCAERLPQYVELTGLELSLLRARFFREMIALVALAVGVLFTLSFLCIAIIITASGTHYFIQTAWAVAGGWLLVVVFALIALKSRRPAQTLLVLREEIERDIQTIKEAM